MNFKRLGYQLLAVVNPAYWIRNNRTTKAWDKSLWDAIARGDISYVGQYEAVVDGKLVWIENYPYASGCSSCRASIPESCSRATAIYLHKNLRAARIEDRLAGRNEDIIYNKHKDMT